MLFKKNNSYLPYFLLFFVGITVIFIVIDYPVLNRLQMTSLKSNMKVKLANTGLNSHRPSLLPQPNATVLQQPGFIRDSDQIYRNKTLTTTLNRKEDVRIVIILAYMHTGSSYIASIIKNHPGTFYEFEPLRYLQTSAKRYQWIRFLNGTTRQLSGQDIDTDTATEAVSNMIACQHENLDIGTVSTNYGSLLAVSDAKEYYKCVHSKGQSEIRSSSRMGRVPPQVIKRYNSLKTKFSGNLKKFQEMKTPNDLHRNYRPTRNKLSKQRLHLSKRLKYDAAWSNDKDSVIQHWSSVKENIKSCLPDFDLKCKKANIRLIKFIRMTMEMGKRLLEENDKVRIIHLLRDPRAMLDSQLRKNDMNVRRYKNFVNRTEYMCTHMRRDLVLSEALKKSFPERILTLRYEDFVDDPLKTAQRIFGFIDVPWTAKDKEFIISTSIELDKNATYRASVWRDHLTHHHLLVVDRYCYDLYRKLGYIELSSVDIKNLELPDHKKDFNTPF